MNKLKLLVTASLLVGGGIFALYAADGVTSAKAAEAKSDIGIELSDGTYKLGLYQQQLKKYIYLNGQMDGYYAASTDNFSDAADVKIDVIDSEALTFTMQLDDGKYIGAVKSGDHNNIKLNLDNPFEWTFSSDTHLISGMCGDTEIFIGNYDNFDTFSLSKISYSTNPSNNLAHLYSKEAGIVNISLNYGMNLEHSKTFIGNMFEPITLPSDVNPEIDGYILTWYTTENFAVGTEFDISQPITEDVSLYAKYIELTKENYFESLSTQTSIKATSETVIDKKTFSVDLVGISSSGNKYFKDIGDKLAALMFENESENWKVSFNQNSSNNPGFYKTDSSLRFYTDDILTFSNDNGIFSITLTETNGKGFEILNNEGEVLYSETGKVTNKTYNFDECKSIIIKANGTIKISKLEFETYGNVISPKEVSLRFGANIPLDHYVSTDASYGIILADGTKIAEGSDLNKLYNGSTTAADYVTYLKQQNISAYQAAFTSDEIAYVATPNSTVDLDETDPTAKYAQFALVIDDLLEHMNQTFAAVCYMEYEGQLYLMKEARHSINSVVDAYLADEETMSKLTDNSIAILNALNAM